MSRRTGFDARTTTLILNRDQGRCARCGISVEHGARGQDWDIHHRIPRGMGGTRDPRVGIAANGVVLCRACHIWVETNRQDARYEGWIISRSGSISPTDVPFIHAIHGYGVINDAGVFDRDTVPF